MIRACSRVISALVDSGARRATVYLSPSLTVKATRVLYRAYSRKPRPNKRKIELVLTVGAPNYEERRFIRQCKSAGEPFPVRRLQLKQMPK